MPTLPFDHGWAAIHSISSQPSASSRGVYSPMDDAVAFARATDIDAHAGNAGLGKDGVGRFVTQAGSVALAIGQVFEDGWNGRLFGALRHQMRAASRVPSFSVIHSFSISTVKLRFVMECRLTHRARYGCAI